MRKLISWVLLMVLLASTVSALGIAPSSKVIDFKPGASHDVELRIINNERKDITVIVSARGQYSNITSVKDSLLKISAEEDSKTFNYKVNMPYELPPGEQKTELVITEFVTNEQTGNSLTAASSVISELRIRVPFPDKYANAKLEIRAGKVGEDVEFTIPVYNLGSETLNRVKAVVEIFGPTWERLGRVETNEILINAQDKGKLSAKWPAKVSPGVYHARAMVEYDGKTVQAEENFNVDDIVVELGRIEVPEFRIGEVAQFNLLLENRWNDIVKDVYADVWVSDSKGNEYMRFKTASVDIPALSMQNLTAYWYTKGVNMGVYSLGVMLHYAGRDSEISREIKVNADSIETGFGSTAAVISSGTSFRDNLLVVIVIILIIVNILWLVFFVKRLRKS